MLKLIKKRGISIMAKTINFFIISDSSGATTQTVAQTAASQFPTLEPKLHRFPFVQTESILTGILHMAQEQQAMIFHTLVNQELSDMVTNYAKDHGLYSFDCIQTPMGFITQATGLIPENVPGLIHDLNPAYFSRIDAMEFAVTNDDGKNPKGMLEADIVLLGVSRTSKTPLSLYLANQGLRVANLPVGPDLKIPAELKQVDHNRIFGLTNSPEKLSQIRRQRMLAYGLKAETPYSDTSHIRQELEYAINLYRRIDCLTINVANKSIEETASIILESLNIDLQK